MARPHECSKSYAIVSLLAVLVCIAKLFVAMYMSSVTGAFRQIAGDGYFWIALLLLVLEILVLILHCLVCIGSDHDEGCMTISPGIALGVILLIELGVGSSVLITMNQTEGNIETSLNSSFTNYENDNYPDQTQMWDQLQQALQCCGLINNGTDYQTILHKPTPQSCCINAANINTLLPTAGCNTTIPARIFRNPCTNALKGHLYNTALSTIVLAAHHMLFVLLIFVHYFNCCRNLRRAADGYEDIESD